ncbi:hypothetical protein F2P56_028187 [Juglans regia]|uniref:GRF-type domain-containing protein n=1 Tax=Juglans regia TaxID=51240 RepID=A0A833TWC3_JUGRE|nr:hypothetical protein F2P56_028187 [Juglans regia]
MSSSSSSSTTFGSSFAKHTLGIPFCFCDVEATLKFSNTKKNPGRPFLGCPNYNTEGLPYCKFFKWGDSNQVNEFQLRERTNEVLRKERELEKRVEYVEKREIELRKRSDDIEKREMLLSNINEEVRKKESVLVVREAEIKRSRTLLRVYWAFAFVFGCCIGLRT